ncbi:hypothetical protein HFP15_33385 [Amycolatopsis sp. K13G38]|uniref:Uncharacterized protein n=1 Tax=Amycolatopsis acididurans TaxID=2724524 RepID=A0ABX1JD97_9PSEU|nr:hypothetical protein [Amycolatopsis acididurans]NKQ57765.1 hypothetical protein [Amycolatopsis acididurans]
MRTVLARRLIALTPDDRAEHANGLLISEGGKSLLNPGTALDNIAHAMEQVDLVSAREPVRGDSRHPAHA